MARKFRTAADIPQMEILPTGITSLDYALGTGGFPLGAQVEIFGKESVGKSLLSYYLIAEAQKRGHKAMLIDPEGCFDRGWAKKTSGLMIRDLAYEDPPPTSEAVQLVFDAVGSGEFRIVLFDSLGCLVDDSPKDETTIRMGGAAQMIQNMCIRTNKLARDNRCVVVYLNQARDVIGAGNPTGLPLEESPGGRNKRHMMWVRIHLKTGDIFKTGSGDATEYFGFRTKANIIKNKKSAPRKKAAWNIWYDDTTSGILGIDKEQDVLEVAMSSGIIERSGSWFTHKSFDDKIQGGDKVVEYLRANSDKKELIIEEVRELIKKQYEENFNFDDD